MVWWCEGGGHCTYLCIAVGERVVQFCDTGGGVHVLCQCGGNHVTERLVLSTQNFARVPWHYEFCDDSHGATMGTRGTVTVIYICNSVCDFELNSVTEKPNAHNSVM